MKQNNFKTIYEVRSGSHLYGTNNINSDEDFRGICVVTISQMIDPFENFEQQIETKETDRVVYNIQKFFPLCADANPNILELLFADEKNIVVMSEDGEYLLDNRHLFLSQKIRKTFMGYAEAQLKRIKLHRGYLLNPPKGKPERKDFGLPESPFFGNEKMNSVIHAPEETISPQWREYVLKEKQYRSASEDWQKYQQWKQNRNPKRFEIEKKYNYDVKHANHLFRLLFEGQELLQTCNLNFPLKSAPFLRAVLNGDFTYEQLINAFETQKIEFDKCESILPNKPNLDKLKEVYYNIVYNQ